MERKIHKKSKVLSSESINWCDRPDKYLLGCDPACTSNGSECTVEMLFLGSTMVPVQVSKVQKEGVQTVEGSEQVAEQSFERY